MRRWSAMAVAAAVLAPFAAASPARAAGIDASIDTLAWLAGTWRGALGRSVVEERWAPPMAGGMIGMTRIGSSERIGLYEFQSIEPESLGLTLRIRHFRRGLVPFARDPVASGYPLARVGPDLAEFENPDPSSTDARLIRYHRFAPDSLLLRLVDVKDGKDVYTDFRLGREP